jgi:hypothetical protein
MLPYAGVHVLIALPLTWNLYCALCAVERFSGGGLGAVRGLSAVDSVISGSCRLTSAARSSASPGILARLLVRSDSNWRLEELRASYEGIRATELRLYRGLVELAQLEHDVAFTPPGRTAGLPSAGSINRTIAAARRLRRLDYYHDIAIGHQSHTS